jgi:transposase
LLFGEKSKLPVYQTVYSGSLNDVSIKIAVVKEFEAIVGTSNILLVNDKGFYSKENILYLEKHSNVKFLSAVPLNNIDAKNVINKISESKILDSFSSIIYTSHKNIKGTTQLITWYNSHKYFTHVFFDVHKYLKKKSDFEEDLKDACDSYLNGKLLPADEKFFNKYLVVNHAKSIKSKYHVTGNEAEINNYLKY